MASPIADPAATPPALPHRPGARLFAIADPQWPAPVRDAIYAVRARHDPQHRLLGPHVTLEFGTSCCSAADYTAAVRQVAARQAAFDLTLSDARPWTAPDGSVYLFLVPSAGAAALAELHAQLAQALGLPADRPLFAPHVTIGRLASAAAAAQALAALPAGIVGATGRIDHLVVGALDGGTFTPLHRLPLAGAAPTPETACSTT